MKVLLSLFAVLTIVCLQVACQKDGDDDDDSGGVPSGGGGSGEVRTVGMTGTLSLELTLTEIDMPDKIMAFEIVNGPTSKTFAEILADRLDVTSFDVAADGTFAADVETDDSLYGDQEVINALVSYTASGDRIAEGKTFQFLGLSSGEDTLLAIPSRLAKGDLEFGEVELGSSDAGDEGRAELEASSEVFELSDEALEQMANTSKVLKLVRNRYMNVSETSFMEPIVGFYWRTILDIDADVSAWVDVERIVQSFYDITINSYNVESFTPEKFCTGLDLAEVKLTPPVPVDRYTTNLDPDQANIVEDVADFDNSGYSKHEDMSNDNFFYCTKGVDGITHTYGYTIDQKSVGANMAGALVGSPPAGYWELEIDGTVAGTFDLEAAAPSKETMLLPALYIGKNGDNQISDIRMQFYKHNGTTYEKITDLDALKTYTSLNTVEISLEVTGADSSLKNYWMKRVDGDGELDESGSFLRAFMRDGEGKTIADDTDNIVKYEPCNYDDNSGDCVTGLNLYMNVFNIANNFVWTFKQ